MSRLALDITAPHGWGRACRTALAAAQAHTPPPTLSRGHRVSVSVVDNATMQQLNHQYRGKNYATNVLAFVAPAGLVVPPSHHQPLGEIILAEQVVRAEAKQYGKPLLQHLSHLVVHGYLHLLGYDHETNDHDARVMMAREIAILATLDIPSPYSDDVRHA